MKYLFTAPGLSAPTYETLEEHTYKAFGKIERLVPQNGDGEATLRISVAKEGDEFVVTGELSVLGGCVSKEKNRDLRRAIDKLSHEIRALIVKNKTKRRLNKMTDKIRNLRDQLLNRNIE
ncbi:hypothetical protein BAC3_01404 [uncultured bacterium]|jgi:ribosome-associated translation inhibitor RaiA|nr:hypothetical protein [Candidatus Dojkabacteria bacterium]CAG1770890.1 hypothetical protein BAC3_01404 [uncultured bacterium]